MAENEQAQAKEQNQEKTKERAKIENAAQVLEESCNKLVKFGGFDFLESVMDGVQNMNPERKARKKIFLSESDKKKERDTLKQTVSMWLDMMTEGDTLSDMVTKAQSNSETAEQLLKVNLQKAVETTRELETAYRSVALFFKNTESDKVKNVSFFNAELDQLKDLDNTRFIDYAAGELKNCYDRLDLRDNYGLMVIPGYLGSNKVVEKWAKIAYENKVMLVTDFEHLDQPDDVMEMFESANLTGGDAYRSNVMMACNWLVGRGKYSEVGEQEDLFVAPSSALAGKVYQTLMSQVTAGKKHGAMNEVDSVKFDLKKSDIASLEKLGLIPMVNEYGKVLAFSAKTLFNGDNLGLQTYSVVRVFDYITKVLMDFLNRRAFENFDSATQKDLLNQIIKFLKGVTGPGKLIEKFTIDRFEQDPLQKDKVYLDINMTPYFPAKNFMIKMDGQKGIDEAAWNAAYEQQ